MLPDSFQQCPNQPQQFQRNTQFANTEQLKVKKLLQLKIKIIVLTEDKTAS